ncbi:hypothetical protein C0Q70_15833 [Pomacea canaliculata]|uniref:Uncharacterized protein n=1 Tax=Pomacea canaliculata TaxID=400727 RepID=A0A2T7NVY6_POMCA|nr:hypothetical protein C0Q70_15833 [Pomacea canaliculata]
MHERRARECLSRLAGLLDSLLNGSWSLALSSCPPNGLTGSCPPLTPTVCVASRSQALHCPPCLSNPDGTLTLHYYSCRHGLSDIVKGVSGSGVSGVSGVPPHQVVCLPVAGVLRAVGSEIFNQSVRLELVSTEQNDLGGGRSQEHSVFIVHFLDDTGRREATGGATVVSHAERRVSQTCHVHCVSVSVSVTHCVMSTV